MLLVVMLAAEPHPLKSGYLDSANIWLTTYKNHKEYEALLSEYESLSRQVARAQRLGEAARDLQEQKALLEAKIRLYEGLPRSFLELTQLPLPDVDRIEINLISYLGEAPMRAFERQVDRFRQLQRSYEEALKYLAAYEKRIMEARADLPDLLSRVREDRRYFELAHSLILKQQEVIESRRHQLKDRLERYREHDLMRLMFSAAVVLVVLTTSWALRRLIRRLVEDEERSLFWTKSVNAAAIAAVALFFIFHYIDNLLYALTFIGFVAAALTIVLKEAVLNFAAWIQMLLGSKIRIGDRILIYHEMQPIIGDVLQITPMRLTLYEEITHNSAAETKRAGRVIFVPNNFIFTRPIFNYTHDRMKTIYDLVQVELDYETNFQKAREIAEEAVDHFTHRHIEMARRQYEHLRERYSMRGKDLRPRVQFMTNAELGGVSMYLWYVAPYREILGYRTDITLAVIERFRQEPDIFLSSTNPKPKA
jgi:small-conductance mechanosensitive channel